MGIVKALGDPAAREERAAERSREGGRETVDRVEEAASTNDGLGSVDPDGARGSQLLAEATPLPLLLLLLLLQMRGLCRLPIKKKLGSG